MPQKSPACETRKATVETISKQLEYRVAFRGREGAFAPPENRMALGYVVCIITYIILKRLMKHMMSHHSYLIKIKFLH